MDSEIAELMAVVARLDEGVVLIRQDISRLHDSHVKRLDMHTNKIDSLERTRDIQKGASKILGILATIGGGGGIFSYLKFWS